MRRRTNLQQEVYGLLRDNGPMIRDAIGSLTDRHSSSVGDTLRQLERRGEVRRFRTGRYVKWEAQS